MTKLDGCRSHAFKGISIMIGNGNNLKLERINRKRQVFDVEWKGVKKGIYVQLYNIKAQHLNRPLPIAL